MKQAIFIWLRIIIFSLGSKYITCSPVSAQVTSDSTVNTQVNQNGNVSEITGGETREGNLFHSFQDFSVGLGNEAFFNNATDISNIFSRVTGGNISNIDGLIRANDANLFLINPAGILFGAGARLDLGGGSFYGSSADSILFEDGEFSATDLDNPPLLTVNAPIGLNFRDNPGDITVRGDGNGARLADSEIIDTQDALRVGSDATIGIVGGNLLFEDATIKTAGGRIELGSIAGGEVDLVEVANGFTFDYSNIEAFQDISLSATSSIDASGLGGGDINVAGKNISISGVSGFSSVTLGSTPGKNINIFASDSLEVNGVENENNFVSYISTRVFPNGTADAGDINIETGSLRLGDRAFVNARVSGQGNGGNININTSESITLESQGNTSAISSNIDADAVGNAGNINIITPSLTLTNGAFLNANTSGQGNAGNINVNANETVSLDGAGTGLFTNVLTAETLGNGGNIDITTGALTINNQGSLNASSSGQGNAGNVIINAAENVSFANGSTIFVTGAEGGSIDLNAKNLSITSGSRFFAGIFTDSGSPEAQAGDINFNLVEDLVLDGLGSEDLTSISNINFGLGNPGDINVSARNITFQNGGNITTSTVAVTEIVNIGNITLNATGDIIFDGISSSFTSSIFNFLPENSSGSIGEINLTAQNLTIANGARIQSIVAGNADSGDINIDVANSIKIDGFGSFPTAELLSSRISSNVGGTGIGNAGSINIKTQNLDLSRNGSISAEISGQGNGGNITIDAEQINIGEEGNTAAFPSFIGAAAFEEGNGGNITINTSSLSISDGSNIDARIFGNGQGGSIKITADDTVSVDGTGLLNDNQLSSGIFADTNNSVGNAGDIEIQTTKLSVTNDAFVSADIVGESTGNGGSINIQATESVEASGGGDIQANLFPDASGTGGDLTIETGKLTVSNDSQISATTLGEGDAGNLTIIATESINLSGANEVEQFRSGLLANALIGNGKGGNINIITGELNISDGAAVVAGNFPSFAGSSTQPGTGVPGTIDIQANSINLSNEGRIVASTQSPLADANSKNINLQVAENITLQDNSLISAQAFNQGNGGNLSIDSNFIIAFPSNGDGSDIIASAEEGLGGDITINSNLLGVEEGLAIDGNSSNDIDASSEFSLDGNVSITTPDTDLIKGEAELPTNIVEPEQIIAQACQANRKTVANSSLTLKGKGGVVAEPGLPLDSQQVYINGKTDSISTIPQAVETTQGKIQPARGIKITEDGKVTLTAYRTNNLGERIPEGSVNCDRV